MNTDSVSLGKMEKWVRSWQIGGLDVVCVIEQLRGHFGCLALLLRPGWRLVALLTAFKL